MGKEENEIAHAFYSLLHFPMVAGALPIALGPKKTIARGRSPTSAAASHGTVRARPLVGRGGVGHEYEDLWQESAQLLDALWTTDYRRRRCRTSSNGDSVGLCRIA